MSTLLLLGMVVMVEPAPDCILFNGRIWTGDAARPEAEAIAVRAGRIIAVGGTAELRGRAGTETKMIDLAGKRVVPGFYDSHLHFLGGGRLLAQVNLKDAADEQEFGRRLREFDRQMPKSRWMLGGNWDHDRTFGGQLPTAATLDQFVKDRPVFLRRYDGHMALANTAALLLANITADTPDPPGGVIVRADDGKTPTGILKDNAMGLLDRIIPDPDEEEIREAILAAMQACAEQGITSVQDMEGSSPAVRLKYWNTLLQMDRAGALTVRLAVRWPIDRIDDIASLNFTKSAEGMVEVGGVKGFMDGSLGSSTAKMFAPYESDPGTSGVYVTAPDQMRHLVRRADAAGLSVAIHAIGDEANARLLDLFAAVAEMNGRRDRRLRVEHAQHLRPADYGRFHELGVIASMQPYHVADDGRWAEGRIGQLRCESSYAFRSLLDRQAVLAFGSDWPVAPLNVLAGIDAAVNRRTLDGKHPGGWFPAQRITVTQALHAYTYGSAYAGHHEQDRGTLAPGKLADLVVLDRDLLNPRELERIGEARVVLTMVGGKIVFGKP